MASDSAEAELSAVERWIDSTTGKPKYSRFTEHNLEERTLAAVQLYREVVNLLSRRLRQPSMCHTIAHMVAIRACSLYLPQNGGHNTVLTPTEDQALLIWAHRQVMCGHHIQTRRLRLHV
ncbi:hypothetical protein E4U24_003812 [Claviceps purpurea]|nr:hypothetical protein E4U24_003812 [Claviceps purpurea]